MKVYDLSREELIKVVLGMSVRFKKDYVNKLGELRFKVGEEYLIHQGEYDIFVNDPLVEDSGDLLTYSEAEEYFIDLKDEIL